VASPADLFRDPLQTLGAAGLAAVFLVLAAFPGVLFNKTLEEHNDEIVAWFRKRFGRFLGLGPSPGNRDDER